jgi:endonuclease/exonuclease/phosphatase (EEP) superfamily protein YafD
MWRRSAAQVVAVLLFTLLAYPDAFALGRDPTPTAVARFDALRAERKSTGPQAIRLAVWNVASYRSSRHGVLAALAAEEPDIVFVQENLWHDHTLSALDLRGTPWETFEIVEIIDHGILSRWPVRLLEEVPPNRSWGRQLAAVTLPDGRNLVLCNVHMFFPAIIWRTVFRQPGPLQAADDHRFNQYAEHAFAIRGGMERTEATGLILAGDFNVRGGMPSLSIFEPLARDVWPEVGRGWGATYPANRPAISPVPPLARIDQCWVSDGITPVDARVVNSLESDHRMLVVDLIVE